MPDYIVICGLPRSGTFTLATFLQLSHLTTVYSNDWYAGWEPVHWHKGEKVAVKWTKEKDNYEIFSKIEDILSSTSDGPILVMRADGYEYNWRNFNLNIKNAHNWKFIYARRADPDANFHSMVKSGAYPEKAYHVYTREQEHSKAAFSAIEADKRFFCVDKPDYQELSTWLGLQMNSNMRWYAELNPVTHRGAK